MPEGNFYEVIDIFSRICVLAFIF